MAECGGDLVEGTEKHYWVSSVSLVFRIVQRNTHGKSVLAFERKIY